MISKGNIEVAAVFVGGNEIDAVYKGATLVWQRGPVAPPYAVGKVTNFAYTGAVQEIVLPKGTYKLQCWGAQGGANAAEPSYNITAQAGGKGGYSEGVLTLTKATKLFIFVGGQGGSSGNGGWNGGGGGNGRGLYNSSNILGVSRMGCGGGGTDIALVSSDMSYSSYRTNRSLESLLSRIIVAGGGSGGAMTYKSETGTTTVTKVVKSFELSEYTGNLYDSSWYQSVVYFSLGLKVGATYKLSGLWTDAYSGYYAVIFWVKADGNTASATFTSASTTITIPSDIQRVTHIEFRFYPGKADVSKLSGVSLNQIETTTTTMTNTSNDKQAGYVGGGVNGAGYNSSYYGKQNGAGNGGSFGLGANMTTTNYRHCSACGGGGWYGGGSAYSDSSMTYVKYSGGGSGFVNTAANASYRPGGYTGLQLDSGETKAGNTSFPSTSGGTETGHSGNGYAKITRIA